MATFTSNTYDGRYLQLTITESVDVPSNTSTLTWTLTSAGGSAVYYTIDETIITINGITVYSKARTNWEDRVFPAAKGSVSGSLPVVHNSDGTKTATVEFFTRVYVFGSLDYGGTMTLTNIDRTAPTVSCSVSGITASGFKITANSSATAVFDEARFAALHDEAEKQNLRDRRQTECFAFVNRGQLWYATLSVKQLAELTAWYKDWLKVTETKVVPERPAWLE